MVVNEMAVEAYRQERCQKAKLKRSMDKDRFEKPLLDNKSPTGAFISGHDLAKCFHRQGLKEGLSRDVCSLNYRGLGNVRALRCSQGPKQIPASWARFCADILGRTGMVYGEGLEEAIDPKDEAALKKFIGDHTGDYDSMPPHSFMRCYVDDLAHSYFRVAWAWCSDLSAPSVTAMGYWGQARVTGHEATRGTEQDRQIGTFALSRARKLAKRPESS